MQQWWKEDEILFQCPLSNILFVYLPLDQFIKFDLKQNYFIEGKPLKLQVSQTIFIRCICDARNTTIARIAKNKWTTTAAAFCRKCKKNAKRERTCFHPKTVFCVQYIFFNDFGVGIWFLFETRLSRWVFFFDWWALNIEHSELRTEDSAIYLYGATDTFQFIMQTFYWLVKWYRLHIWDIFWNRSNEFTYNHWRWSEVMNFKRIIFSFFFFCDVFLI